MSMPGGLHSQQSLHNSFQSLLPSHNLSHLNQTTTHHNLNHNSNTSAAVAVSAAAAMGAAAAALNGVTTQLNATALLPNTKSNINILCAKREELGKWETIIF